MKVAHLPIERGAVLKISSQLVFLKIECNREKSHFSLAILLLLIIECMKVISVIPTIKEVSKLKRTLM